MKIRNSKAGSLVLELIVKIQENKDYLSEIDGKIGDGDHGINMNKGFTLCQNKLEGKNFSLSEGLSILSITLMEEIGGSMGPLYGVFFEEMAKTSKSEEEIDAYIFEKMITAALNGVQEIGSAKRGDKTLIDVLIPAKESYCHALREGKNFIEALQYMKEASNEGWLSTKEMIAKMGRASRLGERSRGVLDAGATSCNIIIQTMASSLQNMLKM
ncbi:MAG TPA: dihydroxyacetone kinase subunit L [Firmicutes bacterium]|jgi:dihydroxyacetone kinase-like protein|nr:dihydroxyacetone kinase subunit L [Bacillota bacterium]